MDLQVVGQPKCDQVNATSARLGAGIGRTGRQGTLAAVDSFLLRVLGFGGLLGLLLGVASRVPGEFAGFRLCLLVSPWYECLLLETDRCVVSEAPTSIASL